jgi:thymidylate synthase ThyX
MKVTQVSIIPTEQAKAAGRPALTPELLAATGARYSRNNEGLDAIIANIDFGNREEVMNNVAAWMLEQYERHEQGDCEFNDLMIAFEDHAQCIKDIRDAKLDKGVDSIFKMVDYGHASIADMAPVALFMDGVSIFAAYYLWSISPVAGGQESSTRYIKISPEGLVDPDLLGVPKDQQESWHTSMMEAFQRYQKALEDWQALADSNPEVTRIPKSLLESTDEKDKKKVERMLRNFAFDRARVYLPVAAATNVMMIQSARAWAALASHLQSTPWPELQALGGMIAEEMALATPRLLKHTKASESTRLTLEEEFALWRDMAAEVESNPLDLEAGSLSSVDPKANLTVMVPNLPNGFFHQALKHRTNRYSLVGSALARTVTVFSWEAVAMAEIRDLNRHRTGTKFCPLVPLGFYGAVDQVPESLNRQPFYDGERWGGQMASTARRMLMDGDMSYVYWTYLGTQYAFEHVTTADKFIYEMELRTGVGAHYRYAKHCSDMLQCFYENLPEVKGLVLEGSAEPE